jgi:phosphate transport system substrate-binding protein
MVLVGCAPLSRQATEPLLVSGDSPYTGALLSDLSRGVTGKTHHLECLPEPSGFLPFLKGERQAFLSSRFIAPEESKRAREDHLLFLEVPVALSGIVIVVPASNSFARDMTIEELRRLWRKGSTLKSWKDIRATWPPEKITLYGPPMGTPSHRYFSESLFGEPERLREDYHQGGEGTIAEALMSDASGIAFMAFPEYRQHQPHLKALAVESGKGSVLPGPKSFEDRSYTPFTMPVLLYINASVGDADVVRDLVKSVFSESARSQLEQRGFVPLPPELAQLSWERFVKKVTGSLLDPPRKGSDKLRDLLTASQ